MSKIKIRDILLALLSGVLAAFAFPKFSLSFFIWIALIPLLFVLPGKKPKQSFFLGLAAGFSYYAILLYWIPSVPAHYGNLSLEISILIYVLLILLLGLSWASFSYFFAKISFVFPRLVFFLVPFLWVVHEYILTYIFSGFPWGLLGTSQFQNTYFIQLASIVGVYGLSFAIVLFQSMFVFSMIYRKKNPFFVALGTVLLIHLGGFINLQLSSPPEKTFTASVIQGNVSSDIYWDEVPTEEIKELFNQHLELSRLSYEEGAELIIWPEFSVPLCFSCPEEPYASLSQKLIEFVKETGSVLLLGTNETGEENGSTYYYNTALALYPDGTTSHYYKMHLVPFGEYTPYKKIFFFIEKMTHAIGEVTPGKNISLHHFKDMKFGSPICYEIIFPNLVRQFTKKGANFMVTITNDGWYGKSSAPYQHFAMAVIRAVENRRFLLRAATTGISGIIDPYGRVLSRSVLMTKTYLTGEIYPLTTKSIYTEVGDILPWISLTLILIFFILTLVKKKP